MVKPNPQIPENNYSDTIEIKKDNFDELDDEQKMEVDEDRVREEITEQFNTDPDEALSRMEDLGIDIDELDL